MAGASLVLKFHCKGRGIFRAGQIGSKKYSNCTVKIQLRTVKGQKKSTGIQWTIRSWERSWCTCTAASSGNTLSNA